MASPGRLIDLIKMKGTNLARCTYLVLDEADRYRTRRSLACRVLLPLPPLALSAQKTWLSSR